MITNYTQSTIEPIHSSHDMITTVLSINSSFEIATTRFILKDYMLENEELGNLIINNSPDDCPRLGSLLVKSGCCYWSFVFSCSFFLFVLAGMCTHQLTKSYGCPSLLKIGGACHPLKGKDVGCSTDENWYRCSTVTDV